MKTSIKTLLLLVFPLGFSFLSCRKYGTPAQSFVPSEYCRWVNPFVGTDGHGHTFPGATRPFGMVQLSPDTYTKGWDWCSGYHYTDSSIMGFSHTHLSGTGRGDLLDILLMPTTGELQTIPGTRENPDLGYRSRFRHETEIASPGYYKIHLDDYQIDAELTATRRVGIHRYTFPKSKSSNIIIDPFHGLDSDSTVATQINLVNDTLITGFRQSMGWQEKQEIYWVKHIVYFAMVVSKPFTKSGIVKEGAVIDSISASGRDLKAFISFATEKGEPVLVKVGISAVDVEGAMNNISQEFPGWDFEAVVADADREWNELLSTIKITDDDTSRKEVFYTSLYHSLLAPYLYDDADGRYRGFDNQVHQADRFTNHSAFSLWDTFRAAHPLYTLLQPEKVNDFILSFLAQYDQYGLLPVWPLHASETNCMIGYHAIPVITDAYLKGIRGFDIQEAYKAMKESAMQDDFGVKYLKQYGYIPYDLENKSVSKTLEYAFDDWCIAMIANELGYKSDYDYFIKRSKAYQKVFDPEHQLMNGKNSRGKYRRPFDPFFSSYDESDFIEGNSWQYSFFVPHDVNGLIKLYGNADALVAKLDELFTLSTSDLESKPLDITGLIGEYAHGNEPSHHIAYLYALAGYPEKAQYWLNRIMTDLYDNTPAGLCGNEDCGQMSAWYVFSALGFYPLNPAEGRYILGVPFLKEASILIGENKFTMQANNLSPENCFVKSVELNGKKLDRNYIEHKEILQGGSLVFNMEKAEKPLYPAKTNP